MNTVHYFRSLFDFTLNWVVFQNHSRYCCSNETQRRMKESTINLVIIKTMMLFFLINYHFLSSLIIKVSAVHANYVDWHVYAHDNNNNAFTHVQKLQLLHLNNT